MTTPASSWLATLAEALATLERAARSNQAPTLTALEQATATLTRLEQELRSMPEAERAALAPHLAAMRERMATTGAALAHASAEAGTELSRQRTRAAAFKSYGSFKP